MSNLFQSQTHQQQQQQLHGKQVTPVASTTTKKVTVALEGKQLSERDGTLQCCAGPERYGYHGINDTLASTWHQRLDARQSPLGASQHAKKKGPQERNNCGSHAERRLHIHALHAKLEIVRSIEKRVLRLTLSIS